MRTKYKPLSLAVLAMLGMPLTAFAGNVGYFNACAYFTNGDPSTVITAAGHTMVPVATLNAASLNGLSALYVVDCDSTTFDAPNTDLNAAVASGMGLVVESQGTYGAGTPSLINSANLPGAPGFSASYIFAYPEADDVELATGSPISWGPGAPLTSISLDRIGETSSYNFTYMYPRASLPTGAIPFLTTGNSDHVVAFGYTSGSGRVVYADSLAGLFYPGGEKEAHPDTFKAGLAAYTTNAIYWAAGGIAPPATTCASEGYKGAQLTWCQNICENNLSGQVLETWIHRWIKRYRDLPYCAVEQPEEPPQET